jgi:hypothetical protein
VRAKEKSPRVLPIVRRDRAPVARPRPRKRTDANRRRGGDAERRPDLRHEQALEGGTPGARPVETPGRPRREQGVEAGRNGGDATGPGGGISGSGGSSRNGCAVGARNLGRAVHRSSVRASPGQTLERGESLWEAGRPEFVLVDPPRAPEAARWHEPRGGSVEPM